MKSDIFISYSRHDIEKVKRIKSEIEQATHLTCWMDMDGIESGSQFEDVIISAINNSKIVLFMLSENSMNSKWAKDEIRYAYETKKKVVPINIDGCQPRDWFLFKFSGKDVINYDNPDQKAKLMINLRNWTNTDGHTNVADKPASTDRDTIINSELKQNTLQKFRNEHQNTFRLASLIACAILIAIIGLVFSKGCTGSQTADLYMDDYLPARAGEAKVYLSQHQNLDQDYCILVDFGLPSQRCRVFLWSFAQKCVVDSAHTMHGTGGGSTEDHAVLSNRSGSNCSASGHFQITQQHGNKISTGYRLIGHDQSNSNAAERGILIHGYAAKPRSGSANLPLDDRLCTGNFTLFNNEFQRFESYITNHDLMLWSFHSKDGVEVPIF